MRTFTDSSIKNNKLTDFMRFLIKPLVIRDDVYTSDLMKSVQGGFPFTVFETVQNEMDVSKKQLSEIVRIPIQVMSHRKKENKLTFIESDRLYRIMRILSFSVDVFGDIGNACTWLKRPNIELGGEIPLQFLNNEIGIGLIEDILLRIKYGIYS